MESTLQEDLTLHGGQEGDRNLEERVKEVGRIKRRVYTVGYSGVVRP